MPSSQAVRQSGSQAVADRQTDRDRTIAQKEENDQERQTGTKKGQKRDSSFSTPLDWHMASVSANSVSSLDPHVAKPLLSRSTLALFAVDQRYLGLVIKLCRRDVTGRMGATIGRHGGHLGSITAGNEIGTKREEGFYTTSLRSGIFSNDTQGPFIPSDTTSQLGTVLGDRFGVHGCVSCRMARG